MRKQLAIVFLLVAVKISIISLAQKDKAVNLKTISGTVTDKIKGSPLSGTTVVIKGTSKGTSTSQDGSFIIEAKVGDVLEVTYVGYEPSNINIGNDSTVAVSLTQSPGYLDEILFTGYTSQKNKEITGSVAVVKSKGLTAVPEGQVERMLQGRVAGLNVIASGEPGSAINIRLHGIGNFGDVTPLYIIDGVEGNINTLNPYDIESVQVLKDAGAYSIYGVRGANGVIVVTTRKGKSGKTKIDYNFYIGTTRPLEKGFDLLTPQENADLIWLALKNSGRTPSHALYGNGITPVLPDYIVAGRGYFANDPQIDPSLYNYDNSNGQPIYHIVPFNKAGTDWFHELFQPALSQNHTLTASGGNDKNKYLFSAGYLDQQGTLLNTFLKRYTTRINTEFTILNAIRMGENLQLAYSNNHGAVNNFQNNIADMLLYYPFLPLYDIMGNWSTYSVQDLGPMENPVAARILSKDNMHHQWQILGNAYAEVDFLKHFKARTSFGGTLNHYYDNRFTILTYALAVSGAPNNHFEERSGYFRSWTWTNTLTYDAMFRYHQLKVLVGTEEKSNYNREHGGSRVGYIVSDPAYRFLSNGRPPDNPNYSFAGISYLTSFISQMNYGFKEKYFVSGSLRRDGSSIFGPENRFGWFPSLGVAWRITEEKFINKWDWLKEFKIRSSWGKTGFYGNTDPFNQYTLYGGGPGSAYYAIDGSSNSAQQGLRAVRIGNAKTGWQEDVVLNIGFESIFWGGKLSITADRYVKKSKGLLFPASLPALLGNATPPNVNIGNVKNTGIDVLAASKGNFTKNWQWDVAATFTAYKSKIVKLNEVPYFFTFPTGEGPLVKNEAGYPFGSFYGYKIIGLFQDEADVSRSPSQQAAAPGRFKYADVTGRDTNGNLTGIPDGQITPDDRVHFGNPNPDFTLGLNIGLSFKNFDFTTFFYGSFGNDVYNSIRLRTDIFKPYFVTKSKTALYNSWAPDRRNAKAPVIEDDYNFSNAGVVHSYSLEKGTYFRNKTMTLGYQLPQRWLQKIKMEQCRVYLQAVNLFTLTKYSGLDPELPGSSEAFGIDYFGNYPNNQKQFLFGFSAGF